MMDPEVETNEKHGLRAAEARGISGECLQQQLAGWLRQLTGERVVVTIRREGVPAPPVYVVLTDLSGDDFSASAFNSVWSTAERANARAEAVGGWVEPKEIDAEP
jgi:hypothetical protein